MKEERISLERKNKKESENSNYLVQEK